MHILAYLQKITKQNTLFLELVLQKPLFLYIILIAVLGGELVVPCYLQSTIVGPNANSGDLLYNVSQYLEC